MPESPVFKTGEWLNGLLPQKSRVNSVLQAKADLSGSAKKFAFYTLRRYEQDTICVYWGLEPRGLPQADERNACVPKSEELQQLITELAREQKQNRISNKKSQSQWQESGKLREQLLWKLKYWQEH
jgi:hypothetical protein